MKIISYPFSKESKKEISNGFKEGKIFIYPTETFYAIGCLGTSETAIERIYELKQREKRLPLLLLVNNWKMLIDYIEELTVEQLALLQKYWPGVLTVILKTKKNLPDNLNQNSDTLAFRMTSSEIAAELSALANAPIVGTSANISGENEISWIKEAVEIFGDEIDFYIDGGKAAGGLASTLVDFTSPEYKVLRKGLLEFKL